MNTFKRGLTLLLFPLLCFLWGIGWTMYVVGDINEMRTNQKKVIENE